MWCLARGLIFTVITGFDPNSLFNAAPALPDCGQLHFALSPVLLGRGEAMFEGLDLPALGYRVMKSTATDLATHVLLGRQ